MVHGATFLSVVVVFRNDLIAIIKACLQFKWNAETSFAVMLIASAIPVAIVGLLFEEQIERIFQGRVVFVGSMLLITAVLLFVTRYAPKHDKDINLQRAFLIGLAQTIAILPGISRSGTTIATALLLGVDRQKAVRFSFLMVLIPIFGANFLKLLSLSSATMTSDIGMTPLLIGTAAAFISGLIACSWMLKIVTKGKIEYFSLYCLLAGLTAIIVGVFF